MEIEVIFAVGEMAVFLRWMENGSKRSIPPFLPGVSLCAGLCFNTRSLEINLANIDMKYFLDKQSSY